MKPTLLASVVLAALGSTAHAGPTFHPSGSNLTYGVNSVSQSVITSINNPAAGAIALQNGDTRFRMGLVTIGAGVEFGDIDNFEDDLDRLIDKIDTLTQQEALDIFNNVPGNLLDQFNDKLPGISQDGYMIVSAGGHLPIMPLLIASDMLGGAITLDASAGANARVGVLDDALDYDNNGTPTDFTDDSIAGEQSSMYVQGGVVAELALGYSTSVLSGAAGDLYVGGKLKYLSAELGRNNARLDDPTVIDTSSVLDDFDNNTVESSALTADIGLVWAADHYQLGATLLNVTSPSFEYPSDDTFTSLPNCDLRTSMDSDGAIARCKAALEDTEYNLDAQLRLEAALYSASRSWLITSAYDTSETETPSGDKQQWAVVALGFAPESWIIPGVRVGYRQNMAGSELSYATFGVTLFKALSIDLAYGLQSTKIDGSTAPRGAAANVAFELRF
ncbi:MAG: conjugal transfer protein TraF [Pseudomonadota bacterium]